MVLFVSNIGANHFHCIQNASLQNAVALIGFKLSVTEQKEPRTKRKMKGTPKSDNIFISIFIELYVE